jgi:hypothetical protein
MIDARLGLMIGSDGRLAIREILEAKDAACQDR